MKQFSCFITLNLFIQFLLGSSDSLSVFNQITHNQVIISKIIEWCVKIDVQLYTDKIDKIHCNLGHSRFVYDKVPLLCEIKRYNNKSIKDLSEIQKDTLRIIDDTITLSLNQSFLQAHQTSISFSSTLINLCQAFNLFSNFLINNKSFLNDQRMLFFRKTEYIFNDVIFLSFLKGKENFAPETLHTIFRSLLQSNSYKSLFFNSFGYRNGLEETVSLPIKNIVMKIPFSEALLLLNIMQYGSRIYRRQDYIIMHIFSFLKTHYSFFTKDFDFILILGLLYNPYISLDEKKELLKILKEKKDAKITERDNYSSQMIQNISIKEIQEPYSLLELMLKKYLKFFSFNKDIIVSEREQKAHLLFYIYFYGHNQGYNKIINFGTVCNSILFLIHQKLNIPKLNINEKAWASYHDILREQSYSYPFIREIFENYSYNEITVLLQYLDSYLEALKKYRKEKNLDIFYECSVRSLVNLLFKSINSKSTFNNELFENHCKQIFTNNTNALIEEKKQQLKL